MDSVGFGMELSIVGSDSRLGFTSFLCCLHSNPICGSYDIRELFLTIFQWPMALVRLGNVHELAQTHGLISLLFFLSLQRPRAILK